MKTKIIFILPHSPSPNAHKVKSEAFLPENYFDVHYHPFWLGFFDIDWHVQIAEEVKKSKNEFELECWRPYDVAKKIYTKNINGIKHSIFPSRIFKINKLLIREESPELMRQLEIEIQTSKIIICLVSIHNYIPMQISKKFPHVPILGCQIAGVVSEYHFKTSLNMFKRFFHLPAFLHESHKLKNMDVIFACTKTEFDYVSRYHNQTLNFHCLGIDLSKIKRDQKSSRKKLGISEDKKVLLHVGRLDKYRGVGNNIRLFNHLQRELDLDFYIVGGYKTDPLYQYCLSSGVKFVERLPQDQLFDYFAAANVYIDLISNRDPLNGGGIGVAALEALASNTPIVGTNLIHYNGNIDDVGNLPRNFDEAAYHTRRILEKRDSKYNSIYDKIKKIYGWDVIAQKYIEVFNTLNQKYYGE